MSEKENVKINEKEATLGVHAAKKQQGRYSGEDKKDLGTLNKTETGLRQSRGKKQRRQFKLDPNRG
jgi:hypothetical protein